LSRLAEQSQKASSASKSLRLIANSTPHHMFTGTPMYQTRHDGRTTQKQNKNHATRWKALFWQTQVNPERAMVDVETTEVVCGVATHGTHLD